MVSKRDSLTANFQYGRKIHPIPSQTLLDFIEIFLREYAPMTAVVSKRVLFCNECDIDDKKLSPKMMLWDHIPNGNCSVCLTSVAAFVRFVFHTTD